MTMAGISAKLEGDDLKKFLDGIQKLADKKEEFILSCSKELAARLLRKVIKRTPVGQYPKGSGKVGGTLRRAWNKTNGKLEVQKNGSDYTITITNPTEYASYVEYGHRTKNHTGWVEGKFFLTISEQEIQKSAPAILEKKIQTWLKGVL